MTDRFTGPTGKSLEEWFELLSAYHTPSDLPHKEMAEFFAAHGAGAWWAQSITVAVEQRIGRRVVGQTCAGTFSASASKTVVGPWDETFAAFTEFMTPEHLPMEGTDPATSATEKWRYWRTQLVDGSKVTVNCQEKPGGKVTFAVNHDNLADDVSRETMKKHWRAVLNDFAATRSESS